MSLPEYRLQPTNRPLDWFTARRDGYEQFLLDPPYQRQSVWTDEQRRNLIKSLMMGVPCGSITLSERGYSPDRPPLAVVDGKQRLETLRLFTTGQLVVPREWFQDRYVKADSAEAMVPFGDLTDTGRRRFENLSISVIEYKAESYCVEHPNYDPTKERIDSAEQAEREKKPLNPQWKWIYRNEQEMVAAEAELYLLINFGGVDQTEEDAARAREVAG